MTDVVGEAERLGQVLVEPERAGNGPADLRDFEAVGEADAEMVAVGRDEHLGLVPEATKRDRMDDAVTVALEGVARSAGDSGFLPVQASARAGGIGRVRRKSHRVWRRCISWPASLVQAKAETL